jgi:hypothetical protein
MPDAATLIWKNWTAPEDNLHTYLYRKARSNKTGFFFARFFSAGAVEEK